MGELTVREQGGTAGAVLVALFLVVFVVVARAGAGSRDDSAATVRMVWLPGAARRISRTESASRDTPVFEYAYGPKAQCTIGGEWAWFLADGRTVSTRLGMYAMIPLENHDADWLFPPYELWRGMTGISCALSADALAERWLGPKGGVEAGLILSHESDHEQGFSESYERGDIKGGTSGQALTPDLAVRVPCGDRFTLTARVQCRWFLHGTLLAAPGADVVLRCRLVRRINAIAALFGEGLFPRDTEARDGYFVRCMLGLVLPGGIGELTMFASGDAGNGIGLLVNQRDVRLSGGFRYAPFTK